MANIRSNRRDLLRGLGAGTALLAPFARSVQAWAAPPPGNLAIFFTPNGFVRKNYNFTGALAPAVDQRSSISVVRGLRLSAKGRGSHEDCVKILTCVPGGGWYTALGPSIDWVVAKQHNTQPMTLAALGSAGPNWNTKLSWKASGSFQPHTNSPTTAFSDVFAGGVRPAAPTTTAGPVDTTGLQQDKLVLDFVLEDIRTFKTRLAAADVAKLDDHLDVIRDLQANVVKRLAEPAGTAPAGGGCNPDAAKTAAQTASGIQRTLEAHMDIMAAAFACGVRRAGTLVAQPASAGVNPVSGSGSHHNTSHAHDYTTWSAIDKWYGQRFASFLKKLEALRILDRTVVVWVTEIEEEHRVEAYHYAVAGGAALGMKLGKELPGGEMGNLWVAIQRAMGVQSDRFGAGTEPLPGLWAPV